MKELAGRRSGSALQGPHSCFRICMSALWTLRQHLLEWNVSKCAYTLPCPDCPSSSVIELVTSLLEAKTIPDEPYKAVPDGLAGVCSQLSNSGFVQLVPNRAEGGLWGRLTELAMRSVQAVCLLEKPRRVCRIRNAAAALTEYTIMELALALEEQGWRWEALPRNVARRKQLAHTADSQRVWYSLSHAVNKLYMLCLLQADELFAQGVEFIPHWCKRPKEVYTQLLKGQQPHAALQNAPALQAADETEDLPGLEFGDGAESGPGDPEEDQEDIHELFELLEDQVSEHDGGDGQPPQKMIVYWLTSLTVLAACWRQRGS